MAPSWTFPVVVLVVSLAGAPEVHAEQPVEDPPEDCPEDACPDPRWQAPRLAGAYDFLPGPYRPFQVVVDPLSWNIGAWNLGPVVAVTAPVSLEEGLVLDAWHLQVGAWWVIDGSKMRWRIGPELGLCLRSFAEHGEGRMRDWLPAVGGRAGVSWLVLERWRIEPGVRLVGEVPPSDIEWGGGVLELPSMRAQFLLGLHVPTPGR